MALLDPCVSLPFDGARSKLQGRGVADERETDNEDQPLTPTTPTTPSPSSPLHPLLLPSHDVLHLHSLLPFRPLVVPLPSTRRPPCPQSSSPSSVTSSPTTPPLLLPLPALRPAPPSLPRPPLPSLLRPLCCCTVALPPLRTLPCRPPSPSPPPSTSPPSASSSLPSTPFHSFASPHVTSSPITPILSHSASSSLPLCVPPPHRPVTAPYWTWTRRCCTRSSLTR